MGKESQEDRIALRFDSTSAKIRAISPGEEDPVGVRVVQLIASTDTGRTISPSQRTKIGETIRGCRYARRICRGEREGRWSLPNNKSCTPSYGALGIYIIATYFVNCRLINLAFLQFPECRRCTTPLAACRLVFLLIAAARWHRLLYVE